MGKLSEPFYEIAKQIRKTAPSLREETVYCLSDADGDRSAVVSAIIHGDFVVHRATIIHGRSSELAFITGKRERFAFLEKRGIGGHMGAGREVQVR